MPLRTEVDLGPGHIVLWGPSSPERGTAAPSFHPVSIVAKRSPISATAEHLCFIISMELGIYKYVWGGMTTHPCGAATTWLLSTNT